MLLLVILWALGRLLWLQFFNFNYFEVFVDKSAAQTAINIPFLTTAFLFIAFCSQLTTECGLSDIVPKVWVAPVNGIIPGHGYHVNWLGLWAEAADGVSVANLGVRLDAFPPKTCCMQIAVIPTVHWP